MSPSATGSTCHPVQAARAHLGDRGSLPGTRASCLRFPPFLRTNPGVLAPTAAPSAAKPSRKMPPSPCSTDLAGHRPAWGTAPDPGGPPPPAVATAAAAAARGGPGRPRGERPVFSSLLAPSPGGQRGARGGSPRNARGGRGGMDIYSAPRAVGGEKGPGEHKQASSLMSRQDASSGRGARGGAQPGPQCRLCSTGPPGGQHQTGAALRRCPRPLIIFTPSPGRATLPPAGPGRGARGRVDRGRVGTHRRLRGAGGPGPGVGDPPGASKAGSGPAAAGRTLRVGRGGLGGVARVWGRGGGMGRGDPSPLCQPNSG